MGKPKYNNPEYIGKKFGILTVKEIIEKKYKNGSKYYVWKCECDCGNEYIVVPYRLIVKKDIKSCGCYRRSQKLDISSRSKEYRNEYMRELRAWRKNHQCCTECGKKDAWTINGHRLCFECQDKRRKHPVEYIEKESNDEVKITRSEWRNYGKCYLCGEPVMGKEAIWDVKGR